MPRATVSIIYYARPPFIFLGAIGIECANPLPQRHPNILWSFLLTAEHGCARIRANNRPSGNSGLAPIGRRRRSAPAAEGKTICSFCPASPCNASTRNAKREATGCVPMPPARFVTKDGAPAAAIRSAMFRRRSARGSACAPAR